MIKDAMVAGEGAELGSDTLRLRWELKTISRPPLEEGRDVNRHQTVGEETGKR